MRIVDAGWRKTLRLSLAAGTAAVALVATGAAASGASAANDVSSAKGVRVPAPQVARGWRSGTGGGSPVVATAGGLLRGTTAAGTREFLGIPYAAPPVGNLRWQPPQPAARWPGVRAATSFAPHCPQTGVSLRRGQHVRGLPVPERLRPGRAPPGATGR